MHRKYHQARYGAQAVEAWQVILRGMVLLGHAREYAKSNEAA
jgi:hypothetical protein